MMHLMHFMWFHLIVGFLGLAFIGQLFGLKFDRWAIFHFLPWLVVCVFLCGVRWGFVPNLDGYDNFWEIQKALKSDTLGPIMSICDTEEHEKKWGCILQMPDRNTLYTVRALSVPLGDKIFFVSGQKLEPTLPIPYAHIWSIFWAFFALSALFTSNKKEQNETEEAGLEPEEGALDNQEAGLEPEEGALDNQDTIGFWGKVIFWGLIVLSCLVIFVVTEYSLYCEGTYC